MCKTVELLLSIQYIMWDYYTNMINIINEGFSLTKIENAFCEKETWCFQESPQKLNSLIW